MKKYFAIVLAAVAAIACQKEINEPQAKGVFTASVESYDETKTFTDATLQVKWSKDDYLNIWEHKRTSDKYTISAASVGKNYADLEMVKAGSSSGFVAKLPANIGYYPYAENIACSSEGEGYKLENIVLPATQTYAAGSFGNGSLPMVAVTSGENDYDLAFKNVCGVLRIVLSGDMLVKTISVAGNNNEVLCGNAEVSASNTAMPAITMTGDGKAVTLYCGEGVQLNDSDQKSFDIVLPPITFENGFTIKVNGNPYFKTDKRQTIFRSHILCMRNKIVISNNYLKFTSEGETRIALTKTGTPDDITLLYFKEFDGEWKPYTIDDGIALTNGESVLFKAGENGNATFSNGGSSDTPNVYIFKITGEGSAKASGNIMSLLDAHCTTKTCPDNCFYKLFYGCEKLTSAPDLPATTLNERCYYCMFYGCTSLTKAPELPATQLAGFCYSNMFRDCTSLTSAPNLPATELSLSCYTSMFYNCKGLETTPELPARTLAEGCYNYMFAGCTKLTSAPELPATTLKRYCYWSMFENCTSLTTASSLPATVLADHCYREMYSNCTALSIAPTLPATTLSTMCYFQMFRDCTSLINVPDLPATTLAVGCYNRMFENCSNLTIAPALPAITLADRSYEHMFYNCSRLNYPDSSEQCNKGVRL